MIAYQLLGVKIAYGLWSVFLLNTDVFPPLFAFKISSFLNCLPPCLERTSFIFYSIGRVPLAFSVPPSQCLYFLFAFSCHPLHFQIPMLYIALKYHLLPGSPCERPRRTVIGTWSLGSLRDTLLISLFNTKSGLICSINLSSSFFSFSLIKLTCNFNQATETDLT